VKLYVIDYVGCKPRKGANGLNLKYMSGPFIVGASMASENIQGLLIARTFHRITDDMITDIPAPGDNNCPMTETHGERWVPWQYTWLEGLRRLPLAMCT